MGPYGITSRQFGQTHLESAGIFLKAGVRIIQYREKDAGIPIMERIREAEQIMRLCRDYGALFIVNDNVAIARASGADGVHLGQDDLRFSLDAAMQVPFSIVGISARTEAEAIAAIGYGASYVGVGAMFPTNTKPDAKIVTAEEFTKIRRAVHDTPVVAIGGIGQQRMAEIKRLGADGIAFISSILSATNPALAAAETVLRWARI